jgi:hypothetical protein
MGEYRTVSFLFTHTVCANSSLIVVTVARQLVRREISLKTGSFTAGFSRRSLYRTLEPILYSLRRQSALHTPPASL